MHWIEQAVFTSAETDRSAGYQVVATSPGVSEADARELAVWGPSHDALLEPGADAVSYNFHALPSGRYCLGRTTPAGREYSGRGGARIYTQCLIVPPSVLARFANNPFALLRAALAAGVLRLHEKVPEQLPPIRLVGRAAVVDQALLARLCANPGPDALAALVQAALTSATVAVTGRPPAEHLIAALVNCLPPECRVQFSFSTGLKFSSRRPFRVIALNDDDEERRRVKRLYDVAVLDFDGQAPPDLAPTESWARFIHRALKTGHTSLLANRLSRRQCEFAPEDLPAFGLQLLEELDASSLGNEEAAGDGAGGRGTEEPEWFGQTPDEEPALADLPDNDAASHRVPHENRPPNDAPAACDDTPLQPVGDCDGPVGDSQAPWCASSDRTFGPWDSACDDPPAPRESPTSRAHQRPHEAHARFGGDACPRTDAGRTASASARSVGDLRSPGDGTAGDRDDREVLDRLEHLDDLVYDAIAGNPAALARLKAFWPQVRDHLGGDLLAESQDQYLRHALSTWVGSIGQEEIRNPTQAVHSLEVLCVLFDQV
jgi:hypothetical protein